MVTKLKLGLIGTGIAANRLYLPAFQTLSRRIELVACTNRTTSKAQTYAAVAGFDRVHETASDLINDDDVEAIMVSLPVASQPDIVIEALKAGKAVMCEKPIAASAAAGRRLLKKAAQFDVPFMVGENWGYMSQAHQLARWVSQGRLGAIRLAEVHQLTWLDDSNPYFNTPWRAEPVHVGGFISDGGVHVANLLRRVMGDPTQIRSLTGLFNLEAPPVDTVVAAMQFESGALGTWTSCFSAHGEAPPLRVHGSKGTATFGYDKAELVSSDGKIAISKPKEDSFTAQFRNFADVVTKGAQMVVTPEETLGDLVLIERLLSNKATS